MPAVEQREAEGGFTLLETIVALTVLGFLMIAIVQGVRTGLVFWDAQTRRIATTAELDSTARVLRGVLTTMPIQPAALGAPVSIGFEGRADQITLVGQLPTGLGTTRRADMTIHLKAGRIMISWTPHRHDPPEAAKPSPVETELIRRVDRLEFAYWGSTGEGLPPAWLSQWDGPALPMLIRVRVRFAGGDDRHWPDLIAAPELWSPEG
jgi:general secretion pathway protein J